MYNFIYVAVSVLSCMCYVMRIPVQSITVDCTMLRQPCYIKFELLNSDGSKVNMHAIAVTIVLTGKRMMWACTYFVT